ncbi:hypothetical protein BDV19DRAFT_392349 [Aspergillus venezuelensis]
MGLILGTFTLVCSVILILSIVGVITPWILVGFGILVASCGLIVLTLVAFGMDPIECHETMGDCDCFSNCGTQCCGEVLAGLWRRLTACVGGYRCPFRNRDAASAPSNEQDLGMGQGAGDSLISRPDAQVSAGGLVVQDGFTVPVDGYSGGLMIVNPAGMPSSEQPPAYMALPNMVYDEGKPAGTAERT